MLLTNWDSTVIRLRNLYFPGKGCAEIRQGLRTRGRGLVKTLFLADTASLPAIWQGLAPKERKSPRRSCMDSKSMSLQSLRVGGAKFVNDECVGFTNYCLAFSISGDIIPRTEKACRIGAGAVDVLARFFRPQRRQPEQ